MFRKTNGSIPLLKHDWMYVLGYTTGFLVWVVGTQLPYESFQFWGVQAMGLAIFTIFVLWGWVDVGGIQ